mgnify:CR=1 FL=1
MTVLNLANDGLFNVLIVVIRALVRFGHRNRDELIIACGGGLGTIDAKMISNTINRWTELGLLLEINGVVSINEKYIKALGKAPDVAESRLPKLAVTVAFLPENNDLFWEQQKSRSADLSRGIAWMLAQDIYTLDTKGDKLEDLQFKQIADMNQKIVANDTRWNGLKSWMLYLGFARDSGQWTVDPTKAIRDFLPEIFAQSRELSGPDFVQSAAKILPVLDGGSYRTQVEQALKESAWPRTPAGRISTSLSLAVQRLGREGTIILEKRSDAVGVVTLSGTNGSVWRDVSHVIFAPNGRGN